MGKEFRMIKQMDEMDCGPACLAMICLFYNNPVSIEHIREIADFSKMGISLSSMSNTAEKIGLSRFLISKYFKNRFMDDEMKFVKEKLKVGLEYYYNVDHSVCSGFMGMLEIYKILYGENHKSQFWLKQYSENVNSFHKVLSGGWNKKQTITGLFYGVSGIGYNLIKLQNENLKLPSLLWI